MWRELLIAFALVLIIEGIMPFLYPQRWQRMVEVLAQMDPSTMRKAGLTSMILGLALLYLVH